MRDTERTRRNQPILRDHRGRKLARMPMTAGFSRDINRAIEETAQRFKVSRRMVIAVACAEFFGLDSGSSL